eukprot:5989618-Amphidinium_carterae.1
MDIGVVLTMLKCWVPLRAKGMSTRIPKYGSNLLVLEVARQGTSSSSWAQESYHTPPSVLSTGDPSLHWIKEFTESNGKVRVLIKRPSLRITGGPSSSQRAIFSWTVLRPSVVATRGPSPPMESCRGSVALLHQYTHLTFGCHGWDCLSLEIAGLRESASGTGLNLKCASYSPPAKINLGAFLGVLPVGCAH